MTQEPTYQPTAEGLKAAYKYHGDSMKMIFDSIMGRSEWEPHLNAILPPEKVEPVEGEK